MSDAFARHQQAYLLAGGPLSGVLEQKYESGELSREAPHLEYPKWIHTPIGIREYERRTEVIQGNSVVLKEWTEQRDETCDVLVEDADQEEQAHAAIARAAELGLDLQPNWKFSDLLSEVALAERVAGGTARPRPVHSSGSPGDRALVRVKELEREMLELTAAKTAAETAAAEARAAAEAAAAAASKAVAEAASARNHYRARDLPVVAPDPTEPGTK
jgi:hypothetical protein